MALLGRDTLVTSPLPDGSLLLETFRGKEALGTPYRFTLTLLSDDPNIPIDKILGQSLTVRLKLDTGDFRFFNGIVTYFAKLGLSTHHTRYAAVLNPKLTLFDYASDCRIFFEQDTPALASDVLSLRGFTDVESGSLKSDYRKREYCVQYRETDYNFIQRLFEEEGIYYFFKHENDKHTLVLADSATAHAKVSGYASVLCLLKQPKQAPEEEHFWSLSVAGSLYAGKFTVVRGYDYTKPRTKATLVEQKTSLEPQPGPHFEDYDNPGGLSEQPDAEAEAAVRVEGGHVANTLIKVEGNTLGLGTGDSVTLRRPLSVDDEFNPFWSEDDFKKEYLITSANYSISVNQYETGDVAATDEPFKGTYTLLDSQSQFRPRRMAIKPRIRRAADRGRRRSGGRRNLHGQIRTGEGAVRLGSAGQPRREGIVLGARCPGLGGQTVGRDAHPAHWTRGDGGVSRRRSGLAHHYRPGLQRRQHAALRPARQQDPERNQEP